MTNPTAADDALVLPYVHQHHCYSEYCCLLLHSCSALVGVPDTSMLLSLDTTLMLTSSK